MRCCLNESLRSKVPKTRRFLPAHDGATGQQIASIDANSLPKVADAAQEYSPCLCGQSLAPPGSHYKHVHYFAPVRFIDSLSLQFAYTAFQPTQIPTLLVFSCTRNHPVYSPLCPRGQSHCSRRIPSLMDTTTPRPRGDIFNILRRARATWTTIFV